MPKNIANYVGISSVLEQTGRSKGFWNLIDQFFFRSKDEWLLLPLTATGGTELAPGNGYKYHIFTSPDNFTVSSLGNGPGTVDILLVGGGGGASDSLAGGGGAGGIVHLQNQPLGIGTYAVGVGTGGALSDAGAPSFASGNPGADSTLSLSPTLYLTALGGGRGGAYSAANAGPGGSGGGSGGAAASTGTGLQPTEPQPLASPSATLNQYGNPGNTLTSPGNIGGGGGGAGSGGSPATAPGGNGQPFPDFASPIISPAIPAPLQPTFISAVGPTGLYGGGGGAGARDGYTAGQGGPGGGGDGYNATPQGPSDGADYTGGGGGSGSYPYTPGENGKGGDGIVVIRYLL